jgi:hypothetical protein
VISDGPTAGAWVGVAPMIKSFRGTRLAVHYDQERVLAQLGVAPEADAK